MSGPVDLKSKYFFFGSSDTPSDADRSVAGPCRLYGVILFYKNMHSTTDDVVGSLQIKDGTTSSASDVPFEIPVIAFESYGSCEFMSMIDGDGYIRFDDGMYLSQVNAGAPGQKSIFTSFAISLLYSGGS